MDSAKKGLPFEDIDPEAAALFGETQAERNLRKRLRHPPKLKLTNELVRAVRCGPQERWLLDSRCPGLALRIRPTGSSYYFIRSYSRSWDVEDFKGPRRREGGPRRDPIGSSLDYTVEQAREKVKWLATGDYVNKPPRKLSRRMRIDAAIIKYFQDNRPGDSDWFKTVKGLFDRYIVPRYGDYRLADIGRKRWVTLAETVALDQPSRGRNFFKALKSFLYWAAERDLLEANPLSKTKFELPLLDDPPKPARLSLDLGNLVKMGRTARELGEPWSTMLTLLMLTGESMEHIRRIEGRDIDWDKKIWTVDRRATPARTVRLSPEATALIQPYRDVDSYLFHSPRTKRGNGLFSPTLPMPINFYTEIIERLRKTAGAPWAWSLRDLRRAVRSEIARLGEGEDAVLLWSDRFTAALNHNDDEEVAL